MKNNVTILMIILLFTFLLVIISINSRKIKKESFSSKSLFPIIYFLNKEQSCNYFKTYHHNYFSKFKSKESVIRNCIEDENKFNKNTITNQCQNYYCKNVLEFTITDKNNIYYIVNLIKKKIPAKIFNYCSKLVFIKVNKNIESELPHTIHDAIVLPEIFLKQTHNFIKKNDTRELNKYIACTVLHEYVHILQRKNPNIFNKLYQEYWPLVNIKSNVLNTYVGEYQRINPDGLDFYWVFKQKNGNLILPYVILNGASLENVSKNALILKNNNDNYQIIIKDKLKNCREFIDYFCKIGNNYHPNEISASLISEYFFNDYYNHDLNCQAMIQMKKWVLKEIDSNFL